MKYPGKLAWFIYFYLVILKRFEIIYQKTYFHGTKGECTARSTASGKLRLKPAVVWMKYQTKMMTGCFAPSNVHQIRLFNRKYYIIQIYRNVSGEAIGWKSKIIHSVFAIWHGLQIQCLWELGLKNYRIYVGGTFQNVGDKFTHFKKLFIIPAPTDILWYMRLFATSRFNFFKYRKWPRWIELWIWSRRRGSWICTDVIQSFV